MSSLTPREATSSGTRLSLGVAPWAVVCGHALRGYPLEIVGILAGSPDSREVTHIQPLENVEVADPAHRFRVGPLDLYRAERAVEAKGLAILGYYHSHPDHPASWSDTDLKGALPGMSYLIVSVVGAEGPVRVAHARSFQLRADRSTMDEELLVCPEPSDSCRC
jgi:proteasome lid subunit RPN8/RPN11